MTGYYRRKLSRSARWCHALALISAPFFLITILLHRFDYIETQQVFGLLAAGLAMLVASLFFGFRATIDLWVNGVKGGRKTIRGMLMSFSMLVPFLIGGYLAITLPPINDVATNLETPPQFEALAALRSSLDEGGVSPLAVYDEAYQSIVASEYPKLVSRRYNAGAERVFAAVRQLVTDNDWQVMEVRGVSGEVATEQSGEVQAGDSQAGDAAEPAAEPLQIEAVARSLILGFENDVIISVSEEAESTLVDMRAAARYGQHDLGANARLIDRFLIELDTALLGISGEG